MARGRGSPEVPYWLVKLRLTVVLLLLEALPLVAEPPVVLLLTVALPEWAACVVLLVRVTLLLLLMLTFWVALEVTLT